MKVQFRLYNDCVHFQGKGPEVNRSYGVSANLPFKESGAKHFIYIYTNNRATRPSMAGTSAKYISADVEPFGKTKLRWTVKAKNLPAKIKKTGRFTTPVVPELARFLDMSKEVKK